MLSSPIFIIHLRIASRCGIWRSSSEWWCAYDRRLRNSGLSTSSKGWSHAMSHSARSLSNLSWSQSPYNNGISGRILKVNNQTLASMDCFLNAWIIFSDSDSICLRYVSAACASNFLELFAISISSWRIAAFGVFNKETNTCLSFIRWIVSRTLGRIGTPWNVQLSV